MNELFIAGLVLSWCFIGAGCWLGWQLQKRLDELEFGEESEPAGLPLDSLAPQFDLPDLAGQHLIERYRPAHSH